MKVIRVSPEEKLEEKLREGAEIIKKGGLVAFPTETVYGLGCDALNEKAVERLFRVKGRRADKPLILHICDTSQAYEVAEVCRDAEVLMDDFFPGPLAIVLKKKSIVPSITSGGSDKVAIRMPANRIALKLIELSETPLAAPSANKSGGISPTKAEDVIAEFGDEIDMVIDGGETEVGIESTVIDLTVKPARILRTGAISVEELKDVLGDVEVVEKRSKEHYRMNADVKIVDPSAVPEVVRHQLKEGKKVGVCAFEKTIDFMLETLDAEKLKVFRVKDEIDYSKKLFRAMRELNDCDVVIFQSVQEIGIGRAIMDRLREVSRHRSD